MEAGLHVRVSQPEKEGENSPFTHCRSWGERSGHGGVDGQGRWVRDGSRVGVWVRHSCKGPTFSLPPLRLRPKSPEQVLWPGESSSKTRLRVLTSERETSFHLSVFPGIGWKEEQKWNKV